MFVGFVQAPLGLRGSVTPSIILFTVMKENLELLSNSNPDFSK